VIVAIKRISEIGWAGCHREILEGRNV